MSFEREWLSVRSLIGSASYARITEIFVQSGVHGHAAETHRIYEYHVQVSSSKR